MATGGRAPPAQRKHEEAHHEMAERPEGRRRAGGHALAGHAGPGADAAQGELAAHLELPEHLDTLHGAAAQFSRLVGEATDGDFSVRVLSPGEIVPALEAREATSKGSVE
jgi:TRAP-type mannitol/chloroaromatic compound transport system substrate-binding protein